MTRYLSIAIVVLAVLGAACSTKTTEANASIDDPFTRVIVTTAAGDVQIERTTGTPEWLAEATYSGTEPDFEPRVVDGELIVNEGCQGVGECSVAYLLSVPEGTEVVARTASGSVTITSISAAVDVETSSGTVFLNTVNGTITAISASGDILGAKLESATATFNSASGSIDVSFQAIITNLLAESSSGNITAQLPGDSYNLDVDAGSGALDLSIDDDETSIYMVTLKTSSGDITIYKQ